jgi:hypothetical protein
MSDDQKRGLYKKYKVERTDGSSCPGKKHFGCPYFVLDLEHDRHAKAALQAYAESCQKEYPELAEDLRELMRPSPDCGCRSASHDGCGRFFSPPQKPSFGEGY